MRYISLCMAILAPALAFGAPVQPGDWRDEEDCNYNLYNFADDIYAAANHLWGDSPITNEPAIKLRMYHQMAAHINETYPVACLRDSLTVGSGIFFTSEVSTVVEEDPNDPAGMPSSQWGSKLTWTLAKAFTGGVPNICKSVLEDAEFLAFVQVYSCMSAAKQASTKAEVDAKLTALAEAA